MKLLLDLQGAQSQSRQRGIGRYTLALTQALLAQAAPAHDVRLLFNSQFGAQADDLIAMLGSHARPDRRVMLEMPDAIRAQPGGKDWLRRASARVMRHVAENLDADIVWYSSVLEGYNDNAVLPDAPPAGVASVATLYDLIPLHDPDAYLGHPRVRQWYEQGISMLRRCDMLLAISEWVRQDALQRWKLPPEKVINIGAAVDPRFAPPTLAPATSAALRTKHGITLPFVLYNGGLDSRKNVAALIHAFGDLPEHLRATHQLVIVGRAEAEEMASLRTAMRKTRLGTDRVIYTGFAPDEDLIRLYGECSLFVFPSLLEGFGLPPLEAMACGAPVIASQNASLPEVLGRSDMLFDPQRIDEMATRIATVLENPQYAQELRSYGLERAAKFSWERVATRAMDALQELAKRQEQGRAIIPAPVARELPTCIPAPGTVLPSWLQEIKITIAEPRPASVLYVAEPGNALSLAPAMRMTPGVLLLLPGTFDVPAQCDQDLYRAIYLGAGYPGLVRLRAERVASTSLRLAPLLAHALAVLCVDPLRAVQIKAEAATMPLPDIVVLPQANAADACLVALKRIHARHPLMHEAALFDDIGRIEGKPDDGDLAAIANSVVSGRKPGSCRRWLVDISSIAQKDVGTGVHRVVRNILLNWLKSPPDGVRIEPVRFSQGRYRYAHRYALDLLGLTDVLLGEDAVEPQNGDTFFGLDWAVDALPAAQAQLREWHRRGVSLQFLVHDLLPLLLPAMFHPYARDRFAAWLHQITILADRLVCVSRTTADDLRQWLASAEVPYQFKRMPEIEHAPPGVDPELGNTVSKPRPPVAFAMQARQTLLMVGTIEPRKGHEQALDALERLWSSGVDVNLVIVGRFGWLMERFITQVNAHPQKGQRLFWLDDAEDGELNALYHGSTALLAASWGEGYGLPLIEAARRGLPVIARDLPIFREVMGQHAAYFHAPTAVDLADFLHNWLANPRQPADGAAPWPTWQQSAQVLANVVMGRG